jgi:hypothetical protein
MCVAERNLNPQSLHRRFYLFPVGVFDVGAFQIFYCKYLGSLTADNIGTA